jgi:hypothetical protein
MTDHTQHTPSANPARAKGPFAESTLCKLLNARIVELAHEKTLKEVSAEIGYSRPNTFLMILNGDTKLPLDKVLPLAKALNLDVKPLFRLALKDHLPQLAEFMDEMFGPNDRLHGVNAERPTWATETIRHPRKL